MITVLVLLFVVLLLLGMPLAFTLCIVGLGYFAQSEYLPLEVAVQRIVSASQSFPLLAVPFFVLAGHMMNRTGITDRLVRCSRLLVGWISGGLAHVTVLLSAFMGGVSGSAVADAAMQARILGPAMVRSGLSPGFSGAAIAYSSLITATIPPSIGLILYGYMGNVSIGRLFVAGIVPGLLMTLTLMTTTWLIARRRGYKPELASRPPAKETLAALWDSKWALLFPVLLVVTIRFGIFTPSEAGAFAVVYALLVGRFAHGELRRDAVVAALRDSLSDIGMIMLIILFSGMIGYIIAFEKLPSNLAQAVAGLSSNPYMVMISCLVFLLLVGMVMEATVVTLLLTPILVPIITKAGADPVHFGVLMMIVVTTGGMTPPVGVSMYSVCGILKCPVDRYVSESVPFVLALTVLVLVLTLLPGLVLYLPKLLM